MTDRIRLDDLTSDQLDQMYDELDQLRAGEEDGWDERVVPTPGQWIWKWNRATPETRLQVIAAFMRQAGIAERCELEDHAGAVEENRHAWQIIGRIRALRDDWLLMTLEPGQVRRLLDGITRALDEPAAATATQATDEPATVTDPAYLRQQYAAAIRDTPARYPAEALLVAYDERQLAEMHAAASARIKQARALHQQEYNQCDWCSTNDRHVAWPCPTIRALDGEEQPDA
jgi:hypothetical protein